MKRTIVLYLVLATAVLFVLLSAGGWTVRAQTPPAGFPVTDAPESGTELMSTPPGVPTGLVGDETPAPAATGAPGTDGLPGAFPQGGCRTRFPEAAAHREGRRESAGPHPP